MPYDLDTGKVIRRQLIDGVKEEGGGKIDMFSSHIIGPRWYERRADEEWSSALDTNGPITLRTAIMIRRLEVEGNKGGVSVSSCASQDSGGCKADKTVRVRTREPHLKSNRLDEKGRGDWDCELQLIHWTTKTRLINPICTGR